MRLNKFYFLSVTAIFLLNSCGGNNDDPDPVLMKVNSADNVIIDDVTNNNNGSDIEISFDKAIVESNVLEYRVMVVQSSSAADFTLEQAEQIPANAYHTIAKTGSAIKTTLNENLTDINGEGILNGREYVAFVMSVADDSPETLNSLSLASNVLLIGETTIKVTYVGNMGVVISDGSKQVAIGALHGNTAPWYTIDNSDIIKLLNGSEPFSNTDIVMATHSHGDHINFTSINTLLSRQSGALYIGPTDTRGNMGPANQVSNINPAKGESETVIHNDVTVKVLRLTHFNQFGNDFSGVESYAYLVTLGGKKILHLGDVLYDNDNLSPFNLTDENIDVVVIPTFNTLISASNRNVILNQVAPEHIIAIHLQTSTSVSSVQSVYPNADIFTEALTFKRY